jgi:hypothetical protein
VLTGTSRGLDASKRKLSREEDPMSRLKAVAAGAALLLLSACAPVAAHAAAHASAEGTVAGKLQIEGGPISPSGQLPGKRPVPGTVQFASPHHRRVTVRVGSSGTFSVQLPPGTYAVCSRWPAAQAPCSKTQDVNVTARHTTEIAFIFPVP